MKFIEKAQASLTRNPIAWILAGLLAISIYGNFTKGQAMTRLCVLVDQVLGPFDVALGNPRTVREKIANICIGPLADDPR